MRKRYHVLQVFIVALKGLAFFVPINMLYRWYEVRFVLVQLVDQLNQSAGQIRTLEQISQINALAWSMGTPMINLGGASDTRVLIDITAEDVNRVVAAIVAGLALWALSDYLDAHLVIAENTRSVALLLWRQMKHEFPNEMPDYMKSVHGVWDDAPPARTPDEHWKRTPVDGTIDLDKKHRVYRRSKSESRNPEGHYYTAARLRQPGQKDPPAW